MAKSAARRRANSERAKERQPARATDARTDPDAGGKPSDLVSSKVLRLANVLRRSSTLIYGRTLGLSQVEWRIVALVGEHAPISLNALADLMGLDKGQISRGVSALVTRRLLLREYRREGRGIAITLGPRGADVYRKLMASAFERNRVLLQGLTDAEKATLFDVLDRLIGIGRAILVEEQNTR
jgi:DNA-binding MarR family transcriptional regulator